ncbi:flagellar biosynthetic protein FliO [Alicyclobacillus fructus]|uniref:flagellar biosynthetic protein FliO n=1 Tax=Alicyclobacillus fructus TaxID=2816082 RepID=UPI001A8D7B62|nr:flagellar biosynthetic protein FliO [Alicyclobacillus fructus]
MRLSGRRTAIWWAGSALIPPVFMLLHPRTVMAAKSGPLAANGGLWAYVQLVIALVVILLLIVLLFRVLGRRVAVASRGQIDVVAARQVAPNKSVQVVRVGGKLYLIGVGDDVRLLADVTDEYPDWVAEVPEPEDAEGFGAALREALDRLRERRRDE